MKRFNIFAGNYGRGKTEISLNTALALAKDRKTTLVDMDVVNPYFRSAESEKLLADHLRRIISDPNAPVYPLIDPKKAEAFLAAPKELGRPWFGQLMAGPQLMAYFIQLNDWMEKYQLSV